jgi:hypothetical protein
MGKLNISMQRTLSPISFSLSNPSLYPIPYYLPQHSIFEPCNYGSQPVITNRAIEGIINPSETLFFSIPWYCMQADAHIPSRVRLTPFFSLAPDFYFDSQRNVWDYIEPSSVWPFPPLPNDNNNNVDNNKLIKGKIKVSKKLEKILDKFKEEEIKYIIPYRSVLLPQTKNEHPLYCVKVYHSAIVIITSSNVSILIEVTSDRIKKGNKGIFNADIISLDSPISDFYYNNEKYYKEPSSTITPNTVIRVKEIKEWVKDQEEYDLKNNNCQHATDRLLNKYKIERLLNDTENIFFRKIWLMYYTWKTDKYS